MNIHELLAIDTAVTTAPVELGLDPATNEPYGLLVVGLDSPQYRGEIDRQRFDGMRQRMEANKDKSKKFDPETPEGAAEFQRRMQANLTATAKAVTVGWYGFTDAKGAVVEFDAATAAQMLAQRPTWRDKVLQKIEDDRAFLPLPAKDLPPTVANMHGSSQSAKPQKGKASGGAQKS